PGTANDDKSSIEHSFQATLQAEPSFLKYRQSNQSAHLHLDLIDGNYMPLPREIGGPIDYFEIEIGNQVCYSAPMGNAGPYFEELQSQWLPYYGENLWRQRATMARE